MYKFKTPTNVKNEVPLGFDLIERFLDENDKLTDETILDDGVSFDIISQDGKNTNPSTMLLGNPIINGHKVTIIVSGGVPGVYVLSALVQTSGGRKLFQEGLLMVE